jgi:hypothetical protein
MEPERTPDVNGKSILQQHAPSSTKVETSARTPVTTVAEFENVKAR